MDADNRSAERNTNLWAPWRMEYIDSLGGQEEGCFLCRYREAPVDQDPHNLVLTRLERSLVVLNRFPYTGGHAMVAPLDHVGQLGELETATLVEMMQAVRDLQAVMDRALKAHGYNIGLNVGRCAGAGLPGHLHIHVVPRWAGDTNFMAVLGQVRVIPQSIQETFAAMRRAADDLGLLLARTGGQAGPRP
ncbi:MAG: AP-4-A phosphorylase [Spirochaetes bacterium ADurb.BinA120]|nr:MAG: AP-4-A phosphorylase [Spirochaetes bacterium ADurb.BinA120]HOD81152.1 HIT domain-containing protein [Phycisphaerae bacterium]HQL72675.1 HIT domain-containing protein [Phycisphaerae bacterium]